MAIYMFIPGIPGSTTAKGYNQWIPLSSVNSGVGRIISTVPGRTVDRIRSTALGTEMEITKPFDQSSPLLFGQVCGGPAIPDHDAMNNNEQILLGKMEKVLYDIYYGKPTIIANYYYSPRAMHGIQPSFLSSLKDPEQYKVSTPGVKEEDFKFYYISAHVERTARKK